MSRILLDWDNKLNIGHEMSIQLEKIDIERGYMKLPMLFPIGDIQRLPLSDKAQVGDIIHIPTPHRIGEKDKTPLQERDDDGQENRQKDE